MADRRDYDRERERGESGTWDRELNTDIGMDEDRDRDWGFDMDRSRDYSRRNEGRHRRESGRRGQTNYGNKQNRGYGPSARDRSARRSGFAGGAGTNQSRYQDRGYDRDMKGEQQWSPYGEQGSRGRGRSRRFTGPNEGIAQGDVYGYVGRSQFGEAFTRDTNLEDYGRRGRGDDFGLYESRGSEEDEWMQRGRGQRSGREMGTGGQERGFRYNWEGRPNQQQFRYVEQWKTEGPYTGIGPQNYQRSDELIQDDVCEMLTLNGQIDASEIEVKVQDGEVTLSGDVNRRLEKRLAEALIESLPGVRDVHNRLRVS